MSEEQTASFALTSRDIACGEETLYGFTEGDISASEVEAPVIPVCPG